MSSRPARAPIVAAESQAVEPRRAAAPLVRIESARRSLVPDLQEAWGHRELLYFLTWRDVKVRYKQTVLGGSWAILQPFATMLVFSIFFGYLAKVPSAGVPYPLFAFAALVPWTFFSNSVTQAAGSFVSTPDLITKVYFPRVFIPVASVLALLFDFAIAFVLLVGMSLYYGVIPGVTLALVIPVVAMAACAAFGVGVLLSALSVKYRDVRYVVPFLVQFWLFATPIAYPSSLLSEPWRTLYGLNPMAGVVESMRFAVIDGYQVDGSMVAVSAATALFLLALGILYFRRVEHRFADVI